MFSYAKSKALESGRHMFESQLANQKNNYFWGEYEI